MTQPKPFLSIFFECCQVYNRIYQRADGQAYWGRCPKCLRAITATVDAQSGTSQRTFRAGLRLF